MSDNTAVTCALNACLCGSTLFGMIKVAPSEHPYAFTACVLGFCHGVFGLVNTLVGDETVMRVHDEVSGVMEIIPLPLVNVDLYLGGESNNIALAHGIFLLPLAVSVLLEKIRGEGSEVENFGTSRTLRTLTVLGNITSLVFLAINENSGKLGAMAVFAFTARFGADFIEEKFVSGSAKPVTYVSLSIFYILAALAASGEK